MKKLTLAKTVIAMMGAVGASTVALAENNTSTYYTNGLLNTVIGDVLVGNTGTNNYLEVSGGTILSNTGNANISYAGTAKHNLGVVSGDGSLWWAVNHVVGFFGTDAQFVITNGGTANSGTAILGYYYDYVSNNVATVTGSNSLWIWRGGLSYVGLNGHDNTLLIENGGTVSNFGAAAVGSATGTNNTLLVRGDGSKFIQTGGDFIISYGTSNKVVVSDGGRFVSPNARFYSGANNSFIITNGGRAQTLSISISETAAAIGNRLIVTGTGSTWSNANAGYTLRVGQSAGQSQLRIENGGRMDSAGHLSVGGHFGLSTTSNLVAVSGAGSLLNIGGDLLFGWSGTATPSAYNQLLISDGGVMNISGQGYLAYSTANSNVVIVSGAGSQLNQFGGDFMPNRTGVANDLIITNGGFVRSNNGRMGNAGGNAGLVMVTGVGSVWTNIGGVRVGEHATASNNTLIVENDAQVYGSVLEAGTASSMGNSILIANGGTVQFNTLTAGAGAGNSISNVGGVYQFTAAPNITPNGFGRIALTDGAISYSGVANANVYNANVANIAFAGDNTFQLNSSSNTSIASYTFDSVANTGTATNYQRLALTGTGSRWQSTTLTIGSGGELYVGDASATVAAAVTLNGNTMVKDSKVTFTGPVTVNASYVSDPSTNTYLDDVTVGINGSLAGGQGDLFDFKRSLLINSTNNSVFDLASSTVSFSGGTVGTPVNHTNAVTGGDFGTNAFYASGNFGYGDLKLGEFDDLYFVNGGSINGGASSNALYVNWLNLANADTNFVSNLHSSFNIYYLLSEHQPGNSYLGDLTYALDGGGWLMPVIPEPSALWLAASGLLAFRRRRARYSSINPTN